MHRIFISGDTHGDYDIYKLRKLRVSETNLTKDDYIIICGDFGGVWYGNDKDNELLDWYENNFPCTVLWVDGNHENYDALKKYPVSEWSGGKVQFIRPHVIHLMRGQVYNILGKTFFTMGGASSHDMWCRTEHKSWWKEELPSDEEYEEGFENLRKFNNKVDYIITHCAPDIVTDYFCYKHDKETNFHEAVRTSVEYKEWFCGHYHCDIQNFDNLHINILYDSIIELKDNEFELRDDIYESAT